MAFDKIEPPDLWPSTIARLLYRLVCAWSSDKPPQFVDFLPRGTVARGPSELNEEEILGGFGIKPGPRSR